MTFRRLKPNIDPRGCFTEIFQEAWDLGIAPVQWSLVRTDVNVFRGMHLHWRHDEYYALVSGRCVVGLYDVRRDSPSRGNYALYELNEDDPHCICFPPGMLHGLYYFEPTIHLQAVSESYDTYQHDDNLGCRWDDPDLAIPWPFDNPLSSPEQDSYPPLKTILDDVD